MRGKHVLSVHSFSLHLNFVRIRRDDDDFESELAGVPDVLGRLGCLVVPESATSSKSWQEDAWRQRIQAGGWR